MKDTESNTLNQKAPWQGGYRIIKLGVIPEAKINEFPTKKLERLFNAVPWEIQNILQVVTETIIRRWEAWLMSVTNKLWIDSNGRCIVAEKYSITVFNKMYDVFYVPALPSWQSPVLCTYR